MGNAEGMGLLYTSDDDGMTTDGGASRALSRRSHHRRGNRGRQRNRNRPPRDGLISDSRSKSSASTTSAQGGRKKKAGVNAKVNIPDSGGKTSNPDNTASAFWCWARNVAYYREYYEDEYIMSTVIASCKDEAAEVFDMALDHNPGGDLGAIIRGMRHHYCGSLTFIEQRNAVENMCQGASEDAADFLVTVNSAVHSLGKDWQDAISPEELETLRFKVAMNGVKLDVCHVLDSEAAKYRQLSSKQIYNAVKRYKVYAARNKHLVDKGPYVGYPKGSSKAPAGTGYQPRYPKVNAFSAQATEEGSPPSEDAELKVAVEEGLVELSLTPTNEELGGDYTPDFQALMESAEIHPSVSAQMAQAIQADK